MDPVIEGDIQHLSTRVRIKAVEVIKMFGRPITANEFARWLETNEQLMWREVSSKCGDYVRMILGQTRNNVFVKFKSIKPVPGVDRRSVFYGLSSMQYRSDMWIPQGDYIQHTMPMNVVPMAPYPRDNAREMSDFDIGEPEMKVDAYNSGWNDLLDSLKDVSFSMDRNSQNHDDLDEIMSRYNDRKHEEVFGGDFGP